MQWRYTFTHEIGKIINSLKPKNTSGYKRISTRILKQSTPYIVSPITYICILILNTGIFPDRLNYAIVKLIFKNKGNRQDMTNYRPISLLTSFSKIIEKLIYKRLTDHITLYSIIVNEQHGFKPGSSTQQATFLLINNILTAMNNK